MRMLMPSHAKNVILYKEPEPLFTRHEVERQLNQMFNPVVTLRSGGYIVLNQNRSAGCHRRQFWPCHPRVFH